MGRGIPNVKRHMEADGGKQLFNTEAGIWFKELKQSRESDLAIKQKHVF